jgi:hypothetical protein
MIMIIWNTFNDVERYHKYAQDYLENLRTNAYAYLRDVTQAVGTIGVMIGGEPALLTYQDKKAVFYFKIGKRCELDVLSSEELYELCKQVREAHLVRESGDPEPEEEQPEQKEESNESA